MPTPVSPTLAPGLLELLSWLLADWTSPLACKDPRVPFIPILTTGLRIVPSACIVSSWLDLFCKSTSASACFNVLPDSSRAMRKRANSLHNSQSCSSLARLSSRSDWLEPVCSSSRLCNTSRYPPAVFREPLFRDSSNSSCGEGKCANNVRHDRTSVLRVHWTMMSRYCGNDDKNESTLGNKASSGNGDVSTSSSSTSCKRISRACGKYDNCRYRCER